MTLLTCAAVQRRLQAFHDRELAIGETIAVEHHICECPPCTRELRAVQSVGDALRLAASPGPGRRLDRAPAGRDQPDARRSARIVGRARAPRARRCAPGVDRAGSGCRDGRMCRDGTEPPALRGPRTQTTPSLAVISVMGAEPGSNENPALLDGRNMNSGPMRPQVPTVPQNGVVFATLENSLITEDMMVPLAANVTREGHLSLRTLSSSVDGQRSAGAGGRARRADDSNRRSSRVTRSP